MSVVPSLSTAAPRPPGPFLILLNPGSGANDAATARATIAAVLDGGGAAHSFVELAEPARIGEVAAQCVRRAQAEGATVVAAGGDGTINAVVRAVLGSGCSFGVLPMGTFNYFSRTHGIPEDLAEATRVLLGARVAQVQVGQVNERVFLVNASLGLYPQLLEDREAAKLQFGRSRLVAFGSALKTLLRSHRVLHLQLRSDGAEKSVATPTLFVGNNRLQLEQIGIAESACLAHGRLAAIALRPVSAPGMLGLALRGSLGLLGDAEHVVSFPFRSLEVGTARGTTPRIKVATDGEVSRMRLPLHFQVAAATLPLLCPATEAAPTPANGKAPTGPGWARRWPLCSISPILISAPSARPWSKPCCVARRCRASAWW